MCRQRFDAERFRRVMAAVKYVKAEFLRERVSPMRAFAGDKRVYTCFSRLFQVAARAAGYHANVPAIFSASGYNAGFDAGGPGEPSGQFRAGNCHLCFETDGLAVSQEKRLQISKAERGTQSRIITEPRVRIERQM